MAASYSIAEIVTQQHTTETKRIEAAQELARVTMAYYQELVRLGYDAGAAKQLTAVMVGGMGGDHSAT